MKQIVSRLLALLILTLPVFACAQKSGTALKVSSDSVPSVESRYKYPEGHKFALIINSMSQGSPWAKYLTIPITMRLAQIEDIHSDVFFLNSTQITDSIKYKTVEDNMFAKFKDRHPDYVVILGKMAFTMRDRIKEEWGDIPMMLICNTDVYAETNYYFSGTQNPVEYTSKQSLADLRQDFNFSAVVVPQYYKAVADLIVDLQPDVREIVFAADATFSNRNVYSDLSNYIIEEYPGLKFTWLEASMPNAERMQVYLSNKAPERAIIVSTWIYDRMGPFGYPQVSSHELNMVSNAVVPVYVLNEGYMDTGALGGVFADHTVMAKDISDMFEEMINGASMRDLPFKYVEQSHTVVNYKVIEKFDIPMRRCPKDTEFIDRPLNMWEKYHWEIVGMVLVFALIFFLFWRHNIEQRQRIRMLQRHKEFINVMPIPYSKARIIFGKNDKVQNIEYEMKNEAFSALIEANAQPGAQFLLFPADFIARYTTELLETHKNVRFSYYFEKTDKYYEFILSIINEKPRNPVDPNGKKRSVDIFAIDITHSRKLEEKLKKMTNQLDLTINVAGIIPWEWDTKTDSLKFDAYSLFERYSHDFDLHNPDRQKEAELDTFSEFLPLVHENDLHKLMAIREGFLSGESLEGKCRYRLRMARDGETIYEWVEIRCKALDYDDHGNVKRVAGAMWRLDDKDVPDSEKA